MPQALWILIWMSFRAVVRKTRRQMSSARGVLFFLTGLTLLAVMVGPSIFVNSRLPPVNRQVVMAVAPAAILLVTALNLVASAGDRAVTFTPAEIDFLFAGPFSRRQLLIYKLIKTGLTTLIPALLLSVLLGRVGGSFLCRLVGVWLLCQLLQLVAMMIALLQATVGERLITTARRWTLALLGVAIATTALQVLRNHHDLDPALLIKAGQTLTGRIVLAPFKVFAHALVARRFLFDGFFWSMASAGIVLTLAAVVIALDANYLETSATVSARRYERLARVRRSGVGGSAKATSSRWKIAMLPWLAGTGPIIWRQLTTALRTARTLLMILLAVAILLGVFISRNKNNGPGGSIGFVLGLCVYLNFFLSEMLKFDFRGDLDHLDVLRSLPLGVSTVAAAQLVTPVLILSLVQMALLATLGLAGDFPVLQLIAAGALAVTLNVVTAGIANLMFLLFPSRPRTAVAGDMTVMGRQAMIGIFRALLVLIVMGIAAGLGAASWVLTDHSRVATAAATEIPLAGAIVLIVWLTGIVYGRFDPSVSTPT